MTKNPCVDRMFLFVNKKSSRKSWQNYSMQVWWHCTPSFFLKKFLGVIFDCYLFWLDRSLIISLPGPSPQHAHGVLCPLPKDIYCYFGANHLNFWKPCSLSISNPSKSLLFHPQVFYLYPRSLAFCINNTYILHQKMCIPSLKSKIKSIFVRCKKKKPTKHQEEIGAPLGQTISTYGYGLVRPYRLGDGEWWKYIDENGVCLWPKHGIKDLQYQLLKFIWLITFTAPVDEELTRGAKVLNLGYVEILPLL